MELKNIKLRWINYAGYEIILPNGKVLLIDPCLTDNFSKEKLGISDDDEINSKIDNFYINGADYILISHVHSDHIYDIPYLLKKYNPKIFVGATSAYYLMKVYGISRDNIYPVFPNETFEFDGIKLDIFHAKHKFQNLSLKMKFNSELEEIIGNMGSIEYIDYCITTKENFRMFVSGGGVPELAFDNINSDLSKCRPNVLFRQTSSKWKPEEFAHVLDKWHAQIVFPIHQDGLANASKMSLEEYFNRTNIELEKIGSYTRVVNAEDNRWFKIETVVYEEGE